MNLSKNLSDESIRVELEMEELFIMGDRLYPFVGFKL
jgi:hypothetical protein